MLAAVGHPVRRLVRTRLGTLELGDLPEGASRPLTDRELAGLRALCGLDGAAVDAAEPAFLSSSGHRGDGAAVDQTFPADAPETAVSDGSIARSVAIDGPTASGKSAVGHALALRLGYGFLDTGLMYRACTLAVLESPVEPEDEDAVAALVRALDLDVHWADPETPRVLLAGQRRERSATRTGDRGDRLAHLARAGGAGRTGAAPARVSPSAARS